MPDTQREKSYLQTAFADNTSGNITAQNGRDFIVSCIFALPAATSDNLITAQSASVVPLTVQGAASQTADLQDWQNSTPATVAKIDASGNFTSASIIPGTIVDGSASAGTSGQVLKSTGSGIAWGTVASGPQGFQGSAGSTGAQGSAGSAGSAGAQGNQGSAGSGAQGYQGSTGSGGSAGAQGYQGNAGSAGSGGAQGYQGSTGSGAQGYQGATGASLPFSVAASTVIVKDSSTNKTLLATDTNDNVEIEAWNGSTAEGTIGFDSNYQPVLTGSGGATIGFNSGGTFVETSQLVAAPSFVTTNNLTTDSYGSTITFNLDTTLHMVTLTGNPTLAVSNVNVGQCFMIKLIQGTGGGFTVTWFSTIDWGSVGAPTLSSSAGQADWFGFVCTSAGNFDGFTLGQGF